MGDNIVLSVCGIISVLFFIDVFGPDPKKNEPLFWKFIHGFRRTLDFICYWTFNIAAIMSLVTAVVYCIMTLMKRGQEGIGTVVAVVMILAVVIFSARSIIKSHRRGELCDCSGHCEDCKIKCRSNPKYYGTLK